MDNAWEQRKLEARKTPENGDESHLSSAPPENEERSLSAKKLECNRSILRSGRHISSPYGAKQWRRALVAVPRCTLVSGHNDPSIGGVSDDPV